MTARCSVHRWVATVLMRFMLVSFVPLTHLPLYVPYRSFRQQASRSLICCDTHNTNPDLIIVAACLAYNIAEPHEHRDTVCISKCRVLWHFLIYSISICNFIATTISQVNNTTCITVPGPRVSCTEHCLSYLRPPKPVASIVYIELGGALIE